MLRQIKCFIRPSRAQLGASKAHQAKQTKNGGIFTVPISPGFNQGKLS